MAVRAGATCGLRWDAMATSGLSCNADHAVAVLEEIGIGKAANSDVIAFRHGDNPVAGVTLSLVAGGILAGVAPAPLAVAGMAVKVAGLNGCDIVLTTSVTAAVTSTALGQTSLVEGGHGNPWDDEVTGLAHSARGGTLRAGCALAERCCPLAASSCLTEDVSRACHCITGFNHDGIRMIIDTRCARGIMELRS